MPGQGVYIIRDSSGIEPPMGLAIMKVPWGTIWNGYIGGDLAYKIAKPCKKYDKHGEPYIHWEWVHGIGTVTPKPGGKGEILDGPEAGIILTATGTGAMTYKSSSGSYWGTVKKGNVVDPYDGTIPDC